MIARTAGVGERSAAYAGSPLMLHIGINTGPVVTGGFGAGSTKSYSVTGDTVNTAQRLQSMGEPGEVLVGPLTHRLTRHAFSYESLGDVALRGKAGSVLVHRLVGPLEAPRTARGLEALGLSAPLIGRDSELARMLDSLDLACAGSAQLVRVVGEAGIGKSRLVNEFIARLGDEDRFADVAVRRTACSPLGEQSYGAIAAVVRSAAGMMLNEPPAETRAKLAALLTELGLADDEAKSDAAPVPCARPRRSRRQSAACRARAVATANSLRCPHHHRPAPGVVATPDHRRRPALGRCRVARGPAFRHGSAGAHAADARGHASLGAGQRPVGLKPGEPHRAASFAAQRHRRTKAAGGAVRRSLEQIVGQSRRPHPRSRRRQSAVRRGNRARADRGRKPEARWSALADRVRQCGDRHSGRHSGNAACSHRSLAAGGAQAGAGGRGHRPALRRAPAQGRRSRSGQARCGPRAVVRCRDHRGGSRVRLDCLRKATASPRRSCRTSSTRTFCCSGEPKCTGRSAPPSSAYAATAPNGSKI